MTEREQPIGRDDDHATPWRGGASSGSDEIGSKEWWERIMDGDDPAEGIADDQDDLPEHFEPPEPPPLPIFSPISVLGVASIFAGFVVLLYPSIVPLDLGPQMIIVIGAVLLLAGGALLFSRLRDPDPDEPNDPDDGAVV